MSETAIVYHPDPEINEGVREEAIASEKSDLDAGYPPRKWTCTCGATHSRGHFPIGAIGSHRCLRCGYVGREGVMWLSTPPVPLEIVPDLSPSPDVGRSR